MTNPENPGADENTAHTTAELAVYRAAPLNVDAAALNDSRQFTNQLHTLDPTAPDYDTHLATLIDEFAALNPARFLHTIPASAPQPPTRSSSSTGAGGGENLYLTHEQYASMTFEQRQVANAAGRADRLLGRN